jgi:hypothetical protein
MGGDFGFVDQSGVTEKFAAFKSDPTPRKRSPSWPRLPRCTTDGS